MITIKNYLHKSQIIINDHKSPKIIINNKNKHNYHK